MTIFNTKYKDTLFRMVFNNKENLLSLYNALNGTNYTDTSYITINTLEDAVYIGYKNDVSLLIGSKMDLYEHQSTINRNMPYRGLIYLTELLKSYVETNRLDMYSSKLQKLPLPRYVIFYNGEEYLPERSMLQLSDSFICGYEENTAMPEIQDGSLEVKALVLNINYGHNKELMRDCRKLDEYSQFVKILRERKSEQVEANKEKEVPEDEKIVLERAITLAIDEAIGNNILSEILGKNRAEVTNMFLTEFDEERYIKGRMDDSYEDGVKCGIECATYDYVQSEAISPELAARKLNITVEQLREDMEKSGYHFPS